MDSERLLNRFLKYIACDSESGNERDFCELIESEMKAIGFELHRDDIGELVGSNGWNIYGFIPGEGESMLFSAHLDTVTPGKGICPVIEGGVIRSNGRTILGADDKSGIAAVLEATQSILQSGAPHRPIEVLFSISEELGLLGSKHADYSRIKSKQAVVLDSGLKGCAINRAPAHMRLQIEIKGVSAHAAVAPHKGIHALKAAALAIADIPCGKVDDISVMNVANLLSPGKTNIVPGQASFDMEIRSFDEARLNEHAERAEGAVKRACEAFGATYTIEKELLCRALHVPETSPIMSRLSEVYKSLGSPLNIEGTFGGSDATWLFHNGIDAVNIGTGMIDAHSLTEHIAISDLETTALALERLILT